MRELTGSHENVLYLDCQSSQRVVHICHNSANHRVEKGDFFILYKLDINESDFLKISIVCFPKFRIPMQNSMQNNLSGRMDDQLLTMDTEIRGQIKRETFFSLYLFCSI